MFNSFFGGGRGSTGRPQQQPGMNYGGSNAAQNLFMRSYKAYSPAFFGKAEINKGNKIILPSSALHEMARLNISYPMMFMVSNPQVGKKTYCGVLEFSAEEGMCYLPIWMMNNLFLEEGTDVMLRNVQLPKGKFVVLQPHETAFINLANPKAILENQLTNYSCLMKGDTINIHHSGKDYLIDIVDCKPADQICVVEADIEVDFREPHDFKEVQAKQFSSAQSAKTSQQQKLHIDEEHVLKQEAQKKVKEMEAKFKRLDGKQLSDKQRQELIEKELAAMKKTDEDFDPRKHRLKHGIRNYDKALGNTKGFENMKGVKLGQ